LLLLALTAPQFFPTVRRGAPTSFHLASRTDEEKGEHRRERRTSKRNENIEEKRGHWKEMRTLKRNEDIGSG
jgi:hypothetical protein